VTDRLGAQGTVCGGGRYDGLIEQLGGKPQPACGFAFGIERVIALMQEVGDSAQPQYVDAYVAHEGEAAGRLAFHTAEVLRRAGFDVILHCGSGGFKSQLKKADASGAEYAVIIGDDEAKSGEVTLKHLREEAPQQRVPANDVVEQLADLLIGAEE
jgi:histidyl-tRNA synthetase